MTIPQEQTASKKSSILGLLVFGFLHAQEVILILISLLGLYEHISHTQFIPGVSLAYWGMISLAMMCWIIPIAYEVGFQAFIPKPFPRPINFLFALIFGGLLSINLLGKLEIIESTQFIPGFSFTHRGLMALAGFALLAPLIHQIKRKASPIQLILSFIFGIVLSLIFIGKLEFIGHQQFISGFSIHHISNILFLLVFIFSIIFIIFKAFHKPYIYHYLRFLLLLVFGF